MKHIDLWLRADTLGVSAGELAVLRHLVLASVRGCADVRVEVAAPVIGLSQANMRKHIRTMVATGYIQGVVTRRGPDAANTYRLDLKQMLERAVAAKTMTSAQAQEAYGSMMVGPDRVCPAPAPRPQHPQAAPAAPAPKAQP